jgi:hypothetical protein
MPKRPQYEERPSKLLIHCLEHMFPGFRPTPEEWRSVENALRARYEDLPRKRGSHLSTLPDDITLWSGKDLLAVLMEPPAVVYEQIPTPKKRSRQGRKRRELGLDCEQQMLVVLHENEKAAVFAARAWEEALKKRFGKEHGFAYTTIQHKDLYKRQLRPALKHAVMGYGPSFEADVLKHGLQLWSYKPGRGDKRLDLSEKQSAAARRFFAEVENAKIQTGRRFEDRSKGGQ